MYILILIIIILWIILWIILIFYILYKKLNKKSLIKEKNNQIKNFNLNIENTSIQNNNEIKNIKINSSRRFINIDLRNDEINKSTKTIIINNNTENIDKNLEESNIKELKTEKLKIDFSDTINISMEKENQIYNNEDSRNSSVSTLEMNNFKFSNYNPKIN